MTLTCFLFHGSFICLSTVKNICKTLMDVMLSAAVSSTNSNLEVNAKKTTLTPNPEPRNKMNLIKV